MYRSTRLFLTVFALVPAASARAEESFDYLPSEPTPREVAIERALESPARFSFENQPLDEVAKFLERAYAIDVELDVKSLEDEATSFRTPITIEADDIFLASALGRMLRPLDLTWTIRNEALVIASSGRADELLSTKVYEVSDLVLDARLAKYGPDYDSLIELMTTTVSPDTWDENGGPATIAEFDTNSIQALVISQSPQVHAEVARLLRDLRRLGPTRLRTESSRAASRATEPTAEDERPKSRPAARAPRTRQRSYVAGPVWMVPQVHE